WRASKRTRSSTFHSPGTATKTLLTPGDRGVIGIGRVKTPTLAIVCLREFADAKNIERPLQIIDERGQTEFGTNVFEAAHEEGALAAGHLSGSSSRQASPNRTATKSIGCP